MRNYSKLVTFFTVSLSNLNSPLKKKYLLKVYKVLGTVVDTEEKQWVKIMCSPLWS